MGFIEWWSTISTILGLLFLLWDIWQFVEAKKERELHKSQVKIWQHFSGGIHHGLLTITQGAYSTVKDSLEAVKTIQPIAYSLFTSLNEERLFSEKEIKERQIENEKAMKELFRPKSENKS